MARSCLFCGSRKKLTKEHVYPAWLYRALNIGGPITLMYGNEALRTTPRLNTTLREVCATCNNGWLHDLEHTFRSVMLGAIQGHIREPTVLNPGAQQVVATWAIKTWLLLERASLHVRGMAIESPGTLLAMRRDNAPSDTSRVSVGAVRITDGTLSWLSSSRLRRAGEDYEFGVVGVFTIGAVVFNVSGAVEPPPGGRAGFAPLRSDSWVSIWPRHVEEVSWPPSSIFTLDELRRRWPGNRVLVMP
jgi:hypothetical protein